LIGAAAGDFINTVAEIGGVPTAIYLILLAAALGMELVQRNY
jgi:hypothetical protein